MPYADPTSPTAKASLARRKLRWEIKNPEYHKLYQRTEKARKWKRAWKKRNPGYANICWRRVKERVFNLYGRRCSCCGFDDIRALQLDHVNNDGCKLRTRNRDGVRTTKTQPAWYDALKSFQPTKYQILCANCNWIKRYEASTK